MPGDALAPLGQQDHVVYLPNNISNPIPVQTTASPPEPPTPTHTGPPTAVVPSPGRKGLNPGAIAGLSIGLALGILILAVLTFTGCRSKHRHRPVPSDGETSLDKPSVEEPREAEKRPPPPPAPVSKTPHFGPCSKLARPSWTIDRNAARFSQSDTLRPPPASPRPKRLPPSSLVASEVLNPSEASSLRSPRRLCGITSAGSIEIPQASRVHRPPTPYYANFKTYRPGHGIDPFTLSKLEGFDLKTGHTYEVIRA